jgi:hypothetical protein
MVLFRNEAAITKPAQVLICRASQSRDWTSSSMASGCGINDRATSLESLLE